MPRPRRGLSQKAMYDLFDIASMNAIDWYDSLDQALASIRETIGQSGSDAIATWVLVPQDEREKPVLGQSLIERVLHGISA